MLLFVIKRDKENFTNEYNVTLRRLFPSQTPEVDANIPFGSSWVIVEKGKATDPHKHELHEVFFITEGRGTMYIQGEEKIVEIGDVIYIPPNQEHTITNSNEEDLVFLTTYWNV